MKSKNNGAFYYDASHWTRLIEFELYDRSLKVGVKPEQVISVTPYYGHIPSGESVCIISLSNGYAPICKGTVELANSKINIELEAARFRHIEHHEKMMISLAMLENKHKKLNQ
jgi:hypothetical protein